MRSKKQIGFMTAMALALGAVAIPAQQSNASVPAQENVRGQENREAIPKQREVVKPVSQLNQFGMAGNRNPHKYTRTPKNNQRQKRKHWRQCPHMRPK